MAIRSKGKKRLTSRPSKRKPSALRGPKRALKKTAATSGTYITVRGSRRHMKKGASRLRDADAQSPVEVTISLRGPKLPDAVSNHAMTMEEFESRYAASRDDAEKVAEVLQRYGLKIEDTSLATRSMRVSGTVAMMEAAFHPNLGIYESPDQGEFRDRQDEYKIPAELKDIVTAVLGFGQRRVARRRSMIAAVRDALRPLPTQKFRRTNRIRSLKEVCNSHGAKLRAPASARVLFQLSE